MLIRILYIAICVGDRAFYCPYVIGLGCTVMYCCRLVANRER